MRILVTGFEPFGKLSDNPSQHLLSQLPGSLAGNGNQLICELLPTAYARSSGRIRELLDEHRPDLCICLGVAQNRQHICLERIAMNLDDCSLADNDGELARGREIEAGAALAQRTGLPEELLLELTREAAVEEASPQPALRISNHAGNFVCNHVYYSALQHIASRGLPTRCLFIHVPMTTECSAAKESYGWELPSQAVLGNKVAGVIGRIASRLSDISD